MPYGDDVKAAVAMISGHGQSVFAYTVLSGRTDAVELVYRLIVKLFGSQTDEVRVLMNRLCTRVLEVQDLYFV